MLEPRRRRRQGYLGPALRGGAGIVAVATLATLFAVQFPIVRGASMWPSINDGDRLVVDSLGPRLHGLSRFDVVILVCPEGPSCDYVKRVVGLPGERIQLLGGVLVVDGVPLAEDYVRIAGDETTEPIQVPADQVFVLGDNRPISSDSRDFGFVPLANVRGVVRARIWPLDHVSWVR